MRFRSRYITLTYLYMGFYTLFSGGSILAQEGRDADYRESILKIDPMDTEGLDQRLAPILNRYYLRTLGGHENWEKVESVRFDGLLHLSNGVVRFTAFKKKPDYCKVVIFTGPESRIVMAYDGEDAWQINTGVPEAQPDSMPELEARNFIRDATIGGHLLYPLIEGKKIELNGVVEVGNHTCYRIETTTPNGERIISFLDTSNHAEIRQITVNAVNGLKEQTTFSDFNKIDGVRFPLRSIMESDGVQVHRVEMQNIHLNLGIMPWMFQRPSGIYIPGETAEGEGYDPPDQTGKPPLNTGFGPQKPGQTAFPDLEADELQSILDDIGKPQR